jgi:hypothetical protein
MEYDECESRQKLGLCKHYLNDYGISFGGLLIGLDEDYCGYWQIARPIRKLCKCPYGAELLENRKITAVNVWKEEYLNEPIE